MNNYFAVISITYLIGTSLSLAADKQVLREACRMGAEYTSEGEVYPFAIHAKKNRLLIAEFLKDSEGIAVVLGPGPGRDLPLGDVVARFKKVKLIDGHIDAMVAWKKSLILELRNRVEIIEHDLSGGYAQFLAANEDAIIEALRADCRLYFFKNDKTLPHFTALVGRQKFHFSLKSLNPDVVISSLVTSQIIRVFSDKLKDLAVKAFLLENYEPDQATDMIQLVNALPCVQQNYLHQVFLSALASSNAKKIYYADTHHNEIPSNNPEQEYIDYKELVASDVVNGFVETMTARGYVYERKDFAWNYHQDKEDVAYLRENLRKAQGEMSDNDSVIEPEDMPVSWIKFTRIDAMEQDEH